MPKAAPNNSMQRVALEIGYMCIYWAWIEDTIDALISNLAPIDDEKVCEAIVGNADLRQKVQMVKALAFLQRQDLEDWYTNLIETLNTIDNNLRGRRNTFIHSAWYTPKGKLFRHKKGVRISKPQAFQPPQLTTIEKVPVKIGEARALRSDMLGALRDLTVLLAYWGSAPSCIKHDISVEQFHRLAARAVRRLRKPAKPRPQRKPSRA